MPSNGAVASIRTRSSNLKSFINTHVPHGPVNIVAHSMGGLDARYLISHMSFSRVASLTTIATPHRGSSFMDYIQERLGIGMKLDEFDPVSQSLMQRGLHSNSRKKLLPRPDYPAFGNLTRNYCSIFNELTPNDPNVFYRYHLHTLPSFI